LARTFPLLIKTVRVEVSQDATDEEIRRIGDYSNSLIAAARVKLQSDLEKQFGSQKVTVRLVD
jgi:hypothetical protein